MLKKVNCNLCNKNDFKIIHKSTIKSFRNSRPGYACTNEGHGEYYQIVKCGNCGLYYSSPRPDSAELKKGYSEAEDTVYKDELNGRIKTFRRSLKNISHYKQRGELLDVGCSLGVFLSEAKAQGWQIHGIDPSKWSVEQCGKLFNIKIRQGTYMDLAHFKKKFDVITMWDVLEHLDNPLNALIQCKNALKDDGLLVFSTVDFGSIYARILGRNWPWLMKMHIYYFDKHTIKEYIEKAGLKLVRLSAYRHTVSINYLLYKLNRVNRFLYYIVKFIKKAFLFNNNVFITFGMGDFMEVYAKKR